MTLIIQKPTTSKLILAKDYVGIDDPDAAVYVAAVEAADEAASPGVGALETATKVAIHSFVKGCKNDGIWTAIKASCILAGARTLTGALVPLVGTAPTNFNFASGDYNRKTGLVGDGSTKYLNSNRNNNADPQDSFHLAVYRSTAPAELGFLIAAGITPSTGRSGLVANNSNPTLGLRGMNIRLRTNTSASEVANATYLSAGLVAASRTSATDNNWRVAGAAGSFSQASEARLDAPIGVFANGTGSVPSSARLAFYSIGESLNLTQLDTRVSALITAIGAAF
jgi:hypothetical protein